MKTRTKGWLTVAAVVLGVLSLAVVLLSVGLPRYQQRARKAWKDAALLEIRKLADDPERVAADVDRLSGGASGQDILAEHWLSESMILMLDGESLVYKSHCSKVPPHHVRDIFLAKGSNGKWYYSTFHFCVGMCVLVMMQDVPPLDLETFARVYHLKEFDGVSDECLQQTQTFPDNAPTPNRTYTAGVRPGPPDLAPLSRIAAAAIPVATNSDPDLVGHGLTLHAIRYEHHFLPSGQPTGVTYVAIYCDDTLTGGNATGIDIEIRDRIAYLKTQKGEPLWSCALDGEPRVPVDMLHQIAIGAVTSFWPRIESTRLILDDIVCCDPMGGNRYSVNFRLATPYVSQTGTGKQTRIEVDVTADGTVAEKDVIWSSR